VSDAKAIEEYVSEKLPEGCTLDVCLRRDLGVKQRFWEVSVQRLSDGLCFCSMIAEEAPAGDVEALCDRLVEDVLSTRVGGPSFTLGEAELGHRAVTADGVRGTVVQIDANRRTLCLDTVPFKNIAWTDVRWDSGAGHA